MSGQSYSKNFLIWTLFHSASMSLLKQTSSAFRNIVSSYKSIREMGRDSTYMPTVGRLSAQGFTGITILKLPTIL